MKVAKNQIVDQALEAIRNEHSLRLPDPELQKRLVELARGQARGNTAGVGSHVWRRWAASILVCFCLAGIAVGATVGLDGIKSWWYTIVIDGEETRGIIDGEGTGKVEYITEDGCKVTVSVGRRELAGHGVETQLSVREQAAGRVEENVEITRSGGAGSAIDQQLLGERFPASILSGAQCLHTWKDSEAARKSLWMDRDPEGPGSRLLVSEAGSTLGLPVELVVRTAQPVGKGGTVSIVEWKDGTLEIEMSDGRGWAIALVVGTSTLPSGDFLDDYMSPSGRVKIKLGE